jgi:hypothetical protein
MQELQLSCDIGRQTAIPYDKSPYLIVAVQDIKVHLIVLLSAEDMTVRNAGGYW